MSRRLYIALGATLFLSLCIMLYDFRITILFSGQPHPIVSGHHHNFSVTDNDTVTYVHITPGGTTSSLPADVAQPPSPRSHSSAFKDRNHASLHVLLLSYQRSGSTIISSLFGGDNNTFFVFEPLDGLYNAMYGTAPGWNVPADITINRDGSLRHQPEEERAAVANFLSQIYNCDFQNTPTEYLVHPFWWYFKTWTSMAKPYISCLQVHGLRDRSLSATQQYIRPTCGQRLGDPRSRQKVCFRKLWPDYIGVNDVIQSKIPIRHAHHPFQHYISSLKQLSKKASSCVKRYLTDTCQSTALRAMKTVRANMDTAEDLLAKDPALKVIHLLRDPRGATRSRLKATWSRGYYDAHDVAKTAHVYCTTALADIKTYRTLLKKYPGRLKQVVLEDFMTSPVEKVTDIYDFLGLELEPAILNELNQRTKKGFIDKWKTDLDALTIKKINTACSGLLDELNIPIES